MTAWLYTHPRLRRAWRLLWLFWGGWVLALLTAPTAAASVGGTELSWTGLHDSYGVPIGAHLVATVPLLDAVHAQGPDMGVSPSSWGPALTSSISTAETYTWLAGVLAFESVGLAFICAIGIWFIKFALGTTWLSWLAAAASPVINMLIGLADEWHLVPGMAMICMTIGAVTAFFIGVGYGLGIMFGGLLVVVGIWFLLRDPVGAETGDNGVLGIGRSLGFRLSQGVANNGSLVGGDINSQLSNLTSWLVDVLVRQQIEQVNFGHVIDQSCAAVYNQALINSPPDAVARAVGGCDPAALAHAQQLTAGSAGYLGLLIIVVCVVLFALCYVAAEVIRVGFKAFFNLAAAVVGAPLAIAPGPQRRFEKRTVFKLVVHGVETLIATISLGVILILMSHTTTGTLPGAIGMTNPMAKLVVMLLLAVFSAAGFRYLLRGLFGDQGIPGPIRMARGVSGATRRAESTVNETRAVGERVGAAKTWLGSGKDTEGGTAGTGKGDAPGRKAHPKPAAQKPAARRPPSAPDATRPSPSGPGREPAGAREGSANGSKSGERAAKVASGVKAATRVATVVAAPEVAAATTAAAAVKRAPQLAAGVKRGAQGSRRDGIPGRAAGRAAADQQTPPPSRPMQSAPRQAEQRNASDATPPPSRRPSPLTSNPAPDAAARPRVTRPERRDDS